MFWVLGGIGDLGYLVRQCLPVLVENHRHYVVEAQLTAQVVLRNGSVRP